MIGLNQIAAFVLWHKLDKALPQVRPKPPRAATIEPIKLALRHQEHTAQRQSGHVFWMGLRIDQRKRRPPATAEHNPAINAKRDPDQFNIGDKVPRRIGHDAGMRARSPATTLIKQHDAILSRVEIPPHRRATPAARTAMQHDNGNTRRVAALLHINFMSIAHVHNALIEWIKRRV